MSAARRFDVALLALTLLGSGALALRLGQDANFDQAQYHVYLGWSLVAGRFDKDIAPAGLGSCFNPLLQVPTYLGLAWQRPRVFAFLLAAVQGLNVFLVYRLARNVARGLESERYLAALAAAVAAAGPCAVSLLGTSFGDNLPSILVLWALLLLADVAREPQHQSCRRLLGAGLLGGAAAALKLTYAAYTVALGVAAALLALRLQSVAALLAFAGGGVSGAVLAGGYWAFKLWGRFGNPLFPFANNVFRSPYVAPALMADPTWAARGWADVFTPPLDLALGRTRRLMEVGALDLRYLILFAALALVLARVATRRRLAAVPLSAGLLIVSWIAAYACWVWAFHYYRYFVLGEFLAPVAILALLRLLLPDRRLTIAWTLLVAAIVLTTRVGSWGRIGWEQRLRVEIPLAPSEPPAVVLVDGPEVSYVLPFFPERTRFFGIYATTPRLLEDIAREIERHRGPLYRVIRQGYGPAPLDRFGLVDGLPCVPFKTGGRGRILLCRLERVAG